MKATPKSAGEVTRHFVAVRVHMQTSILCVVGLAGTWNPNNMAASQQLSEERFLFY